MTMILAKSIKALMGQFLVHHEHGCELAESFYHDPFNRYPNSNKRLHNTNLGKIAKPSMQLKSEHHQTKCMIYITNDTL